MEAARRPEEAARVSEGEEEHKPDVYNQLMLIVLDLLHNFRAQRRSDLPPIDNNI